MTKTEALLILKRNEGYVSGAEMSRAIGVSRAAVNAAIMALRAEGYEISSATNRGYRLESSPDVITEGELGALIGGRIDRVVCRDCVDSTSYYLRALAQQGAPDGQIVVAEEQTRGRGRLGRSFSSPRCRGVYLSWLLRPDCLPADVVSITAWVSVAVCRAIKAAYGVEPGIKWVNDLVINAKKLCGIMTELSVESESGHVQYIIIGIGINASHTREDFPPELQSKATSLFMETGKRIPRAVLTAALIAELDRLRADWPAAHDEYLSEYRRLNITTNRDVTLVSAGIERPARVLSIDDDFALHVRYPDNTEAHIISGEVSLKGIYNDPS